MLCNTVRERIVKTIKYIFYRKYLFKANDNLFNQTYSFIFNESLSVQN